MFSRTHHSPQSIATAFLLAASLFIGACQEQGSDETPIILPEEEQIDLTPAALPSDRLTLLNTLEADDPGYWHAADGWSNGYPFLNGWCIEQVTFNGSTMHLGIANTPCSGEPYAGGEYRSNDFYGYGYYETRLMAAKGSGLVTGFFTYTGPSDGNPHDEIDVEILGKNTTQMQLNYWTNGVEHPVVIDLGFDAALAMHTYAFEWSASTIKWYVDGVLVHTEDGSNGTLPSTPGRIMANVWACGAATWCGDFDTAVLDTYADFDWIGYGP